MPERCALGAADANNYHTYSKQTARERKTRAKAETDRMCKLQRLNQSMLSGAGGPSSISAQVQSEGPSWARGKLGQMRVPFCSPFWGVCVMTRAYALEWSNWVTKSSLRALRMQICHVRCWQGGFSISCKWFILCVFKQGRIYDAMILHSLQKNLQIENNIKHVHLFFQHSKNFRPFLFYEAKQ